MTYGKPLEQVVNRREEPNDGLEAKITYHQRQRHFTAEDAEIAEEGIFFGYKQNHNIIVENKQRRFPPCVPVRIRAQTGARR